MEDSKYDYIPLDLPNILGRWPKDKDRTVTLRIDKSVEPFVTALAIKHPNWTFVSRSYWHRGNGESGQGFSYAYKFTVFDGREALGDIGVDRTMRKGAYENVFTVYNERIMAARERGSSVRTKDMAKAIKTVGKMFRSKTVQERLNEACRECGDVISRVASDRGWKFSREYDFINSKLVPNFMENWEAIAPLALQAGVPQDIVSGLEASYSEYKVTKEISECRQQKKGAVVLIHGNTYAVEAFDASGELTVTMYATDNLPAHLKMGVGMLKLIADKNFLAGVGVRVSDSVFYVTKEASND